MTIAGEPGLGATYVGDGRTRFLVWAPRARSVELVIVAGASERSIPMAPRGDGYFLVESRTEPGDRYWYAIDDARRRPDPASRSQPDGVHGASAIVSTRFGWTDAGWRGLPLSDYVMYELHVGTFSNDGTFDGVIPHLRELRDLGITAIELMPIAQFPGERNWGYDGVAPFAAQHSYGGVDGLRRLVDACHAEGLAVVLDVVYNHLGPEGNYTGEFGPYTTDAYRTPWGHAMNFDGPDSDHVRRFFIESALWWIRDCHIDALRVDAVHAIIDHTAHPFLLELCTAVRDEARTLGREVHVIAESTLNDPRLLRPEAAGGLAFDAVWNDDFHHALHVSLTDEHDGYYADFAGPGDLAAAMREGFVYAGQYSAFRRRRHGIASTGVGAERFVVFAQNHDQIGNRPEGDRLATLVTPAQLRLAAAAVILSPCTPLLFMGEEYAETASFLYFVSHSDPELIEAVRRGRREEFASFDWKDDPPDPQAEVTFLRSRLDHGLKDALPHASMLAFTRELLRVRGELRGMLGPDPARRTESQTNAPAFALVRNGANGTAAVLALNLSGGDAAVAVEDCSGTWRLAVDSDDGRWGGTGSSPPAVVSWTGRQKLALSAHQALLYMKER